MAASTSTPSLRRRSSSEERRACPEVAGSTPVAVMTSEMEARRVLQAWILYGVPMLVRAS
ncbi:hypothetical protein DVH05_001461 [Phytophthora capsici]|nr:hypothetical protein DVH05_001461 [Phytophthora capsici]